MRTLRPGLPKRVDGVPAADWSHRGRPKAVITFAVHRQKITRIAIDTAPDRLHDLHIAYLSAGGKGRR
ncbi:hypothetical protein [Spongiactinospora gelatinilytica]|uniref:hypothetical protein n=1 Tax=Spongiactinospora gelatinilytica TaxID=2666298 RepID=UPI001314D5BC|nr:hypothetical protein [Spongiactinospora gelatinilytica]